MRALNDLRKDTGHEISDRIMVTLSGPVAVVAAVGQHGSWIAGEVLATSLVVGDPGPGAATIVIDGHEVLVGLSPR